MHEFLICILKWLLYVIKNINSEVLENEEINSYYLCIFFAYATYWSWMQISRFRLVKQFWYEIYFVNRNILIFIAKCVAGGSILIAGSPLILQGDKS